MLKRIKSGLTAETKSHTARQVRQTRKDDRGS